MLSALRDTVEKEYLLKIRSAANAETAFAKEHPPKEVTLLRALSAFMDEGGRAQLDRMTKGLMFLHTLQHVQRGVADFSEAIFWRRAVPRAAHRKICPPPNPQEWQVCC